MMLSSVPTPLQPESSTGSTATPEQLASLRDAIQDRPPYCSGLCELKPEDTIMFFSQSGNNAAQKIDLSKAANDELSLLSAACAPATFGRNQEDILDESYRRAGKLDTSNFATNFNPDAKHTDLIEVVRSELLVGIDGTTPIRWELYKLNVYGEGSFFKAHKDTPRDKAMFGSLVIVYPTKHEGGSLVLRHNDKEWTFDSAQEVTSARKPSIGYVAFFSDVEHEVLPVTSGHRVTLTYNLYFDERIPTAPPSLMSASSVQGNAASFRSAFVNLLTDPIFLPEGGYLAFGMAHQYPMETNGSGQHFSSEELGYLKGSDAVILGVARALGLTASVKLIYEIAMPDHTTKVIKDDFVKLRKWRQIEDHDVSRRMRDKKKGDIIIVEGEDYDGEATRIVNWVTDPSKLNNIEEPFISYGNDASLGFVYGDFCLLIHVGPPGSRDTPPLPQVEIEPEDSEDERLRRWFG